MSRAKFDIRYKGLLNAGYEIMDISYKDLDDMMYSGIYKGFNVDNAPDINYIEVIITRHNECWIVQECKDYIDTIYLRSYKDGQWSNWTELEIVPSCDEPDKEVIVVERPHSHPLATPQTEGFMSASDKAIIDAISANLDEGGSFLPEHTHQEYEEALREFQEKMANLERNQIDQELLDERYIPIYSKIKPTHHNTVGQVWIDLLN